jgi:hypothetical protein
MSDERISNFCIDDCAILFFIIVFLLLFFRGRFVFGIRE